MTTLNDMIHAVKNHAMTNYEKGWDVVVETVSDGEIAEIIKNCKTEMGAKRAVSAHFQINAVHEIRQERSACRELERMLSF